MFSKMEGILQDNNCLKTKFYFKLIDYILSAMKLGCVWGCTYRGSPMISSDIIQNFYTAAIGSMNPHDLGEAFHLNRKGNC